MLSSLLIFFCTGLLFAMIPGPDFAQLFRAFLLSGKKAAIASAFGVGCGLCLHTIFSVVGLSAVIVHSPFLFKGVQYGGALYLAVIGGTTLWKSFKGGGQASSPATQEQKNGMPVQEKPLTYFRQSFLVNALNPKAFIFFLTLLPQFVSLESSVPAQTQILILGVSMCLICFAWFFCLSCLLEKFARIFDRKTVRRALERATSCIFIGFALRLAIAD